MFIKHPNDSKLDKEIAYHLDELKSQRDDPATYEVTVERIAQLNKLKSESKTRPLSWDTALMVGANVFGILWLARYEQENVIRSKSALGFVMRPR